MQFRFDENKVVLNIYYCCQKANTQ